MCAPNFTAIHQVVVNIFHVRCQPQWSTRVKVWRSPESIRKCYEGIMGIFTKLCQIYSVDVEILYKIGENLWPVGDTRGNLQSLELIFYKPSISIANATEINERALKLFHSEPQTSTLWWHYSIRLRGLSSGKHEWQYNISQQFT